MKRIEKLEVLVGQLAGVLHGLCQPEMQKDIDEYIKEWEQK